MTTEVDVISLAIIAVLLIARLVAVPYLLRTGRTADSDSRPGQDDPVPQPMIVASGGSSGSPESVLCADLLSDRITPEQYRSGMATLAARDAVRHPVVIPSES